MSNSGAKPVRSPSYPDRSLSEAIAAVRKIEGEYRSAPADRESAAKLIGYSGLSGPSNKALGALASYGLVKRAGKGELSVTDRALAILHPNSEVEKIEALQAAAREPKLFQELQERFKGIDIPPAEGVRTYLARQGFNRNAIKPATKAYLETLEFLKETGASESYGQQTLGDAESPSPPGDGDIVYGGARVGDLIDYESGGAIANPEPMRVRAVSEDGEWVFVDGHEAGLEMEQVMVKERPESGDVRERPTLPLGDGGKKDAEPGEGMRKAMFPLDEGDVTLLFPESLSGDGLDLLADYLDIFLKREKSKRDTATTNRPASAAKSR